jgi:hypothetical protein
MLVCKIVWFESSFGTEKSICLKTACWNPVTGSGEGAET